MEEEKRKAGRRVLLVFAFLAFSWLASYWMLDLNDNQESSVLGSLPEPVAVPIATIVMIYSLLVGLPFVLALGPGAGPGLVVFSLMLNAIYWWLLSKKIVETYDKTLGMSKRKK